MDELDVFHTEEVTEEDLWNLHHDAALSASELGDSKPEEDEQLDDQASTNQPDAVPRLRYTGEYACDVCGETFYTIVQLAKHRQFHDRDRPYQCGICGKRFLSRSHHHEHQRVHTGERPFPCERCDRSFTTHHNLKRHMTIHEKEEMYRCQQCGVLFCQDHEYKLENLRLPATVPPIISTRVTDPPLVTNKPRPAPLPPPQPAPLPVPISVEYQIPPADDLPSSSSMVRMTPIFPEKKRKKKMKYSLFDVSRTIAAQPLSTPPRKQRFDAELHRDMEIPEYRRSVVHKRPYNVKRVAYDIEVVL
ncbi:hypothetical protein ACEWY4_000561 [Coilia grayii]|uniref:C2H2-type domain-containing protein n=1 Tax=Coilia grayii TaxID=363190 RepID=A0ABD1KX16_9TELE